MMLGALQVDPEKVAIYIRWSTEEQSQGTTLEVQRDGCRHFILSQGWQVNTELIFVDEGYSGAHMNRPALTRLREAVKGGDISSVVVYKLDRLSRNLLDCVSLVRNEWGAIALFSTMERFDTHSSLGQMVFNMLVSFAEFERNVIRDRTMSGKQKRREQARNSGFRYPYGYRKSAAGGFEIHPEQAMVVRSVFAEYNAGAGFAGVCARLNGAGIPSPNGGKWRVCTISRLVQNPFYAGHYAAGYYATADGVKYRRQEPAYVQKNVIPAIITQAAFDQAKRARQDRLHPGWPMPKESDYILSTVLKCGKCGAPMSGHSGMGERKYYRCTNAKEFGTCDNGGLPKTDLEQTVLDGVRQDLVRERLLAQLTHLDGLRHREDEQRRTKAQTLATRLADLTHRQARLDSDYFVGDVDAKQFGRLAAKLEADQKALEAQLNENQTYENAPIDPERRAILVAGVDGLNELSVQQTRQLLRELLAELTAYRPKQPGRGNTSPVEVTLVHNVGSFWPTSAS